MDNLIPWEESTSENVHKLDVEGGDSNPYEGRRNS